MESLGNNSVALLSALLGALVGALIPWMYSRKQAWNNARELLLERFAKLYEAMVSLTHDPCQENLYTFQLLFENERTFLLHEAKSFPSKRTLLTSLANEVYESYTEIDLDSENEEVLLLSNTDPIKRVHFIFYLRKNISTFGKQLVGVDIEKEGIKSLLLSRMVGNDSVC